METLNFYIPPRYFEEAAEEDRRAGTSAARIQPDSLVFVDGTVFQVATSLARAVAHGYLNAYADAAALFGDSPAICRKTAGPKTLSPETLEAT